MKYFIFLLVFLVGCSEKNIEITANKDYKVISPPLGKYPISSNKTDTANKIEVVDVFWYGCVSCFDFRAKVAKWQKKHADDINYLQLPAPLNSLWSTHAKIYLAAKQLHIENKISQAVYDNLHIKRQKIFKEKQVADLFSSFGVNSIAFNLAFKGRLMEHQMQSIKNYLQQANIRSVPALIIHGKYIVLENNKPDHALQVASALIAKIKNESNQ